MAVITGEMALCIIKTTLLLPLPLFLYGRNQLVSICQTACKDQRQVTGWCKFRLMTAFSVFCVYAANVEKSARSKNICAVMQG